MKRSKPLKRTGELKRTPLRRRSQQRQKFMEEDRIPLIKQLIEAGFGCEIGPVLTHYGLTEARRCTGRIEGLHERRKRSAGGSLTNRDNLIPSCNFCNSFVEEEPELIRELTGDDLVVRAGDPEWEALGKRND